MATYGSEAGVEAMAQSLTASASSDPNSTEIASWLEQGHAIINRHIASAGYSTPVGSSAAVYPELTLLNNQYAAAWVLRSQGVDTISGEEESRSDIWLREFYEQIEALAASNLEALGVSLLTSGDAAKARRRRIRTLQTRRVDGYSGAIEGDVTEYDYTSE